EEAEAALQEIGSHISGDEARLASLREAITSAEPELQRLQAEDQATQDALREAEAKLADWQQRSDWISRSRNSAPCLAAPERSTRTQPAPMRSPVRVITDSPSPSRGSSARASARVSAACSLARIRRIAAGPWTLAA